jgi:hypothetical protein
LCVTDKGCQQNSVTETKICEKAHTFNLPKSDLEAWFFGDGNSIYGYHFSHEQARYEIKEQ